MPNSINISNTKFELSSASNTEKQYAFPSDAVQSIAESLLQEGTCLYFFEFDDNFFDINSSSSLQATSPFAGLFEALNRLKPHFDKANAITTYCELMEHTQNIESSWKAKQDSSESLFLARKLAHHVIMKANKNAAHIEVLKGCLALVPDDDTTIARISQNQQEITHLKVLGKKLMSTINHLKKQIKTDQIQ